MRTLQDASKIRSAKEDAENPPNWKNKNAYQHKTHAYRLIPWPWVVWESGLEEIWRLGGSGIKEVRVGGQGTHGLSWLECSRLCINVRVSNKHDAMFCDSWELRFFFFKFMAFSEIQCETKCLHPLNLKGCVNDTAICTRAQANATRFANWNWTPLWFLVWAKFCHCPLVWMKRMTASEKFVPGAEDFKEYLQQWNAQLQCGHRPTSQLLLRESLACRSLLCHPSSHLNKTKKIV